MADEQVAVLAKIKAKPDKIEELKAELVAMMEPSRAESGCVKYNLHVSDEDEAQFMFYEVWRSKEDFNLHIETPHLQGLLAKMGEFIEGELDVSMWKLV
jgi:quinol monooxygenase YgiN